MSPPGLLDGGSGAACRDDGSGFGVDGVVHPSAVHTTTPAHSVDAAQPLVVHRPHDPESGRRPGGLPRHPHASVSEPLRPGQEERRDPSAFPLVGALWSVSTQRAKEDDPAPGGRACGGRAEWLPTRAGPGLLTAVLVGVRALWGEPRVVVLPLDVRPVAPRCSVGMIH